MLTLGTAAIHFSVAPDHLDEFLPFGILFLATGSAQVALAALVVLLPGRRVFAATMAVALACLLVWAVSRTVGLPVGPHSSQPEALGTGGCPGQHLRSALRAAVPAAAQELAAAQHAALVAGRHRPDRPAADCHVLIHATFGLSTMITR
jgi:hypothetical protein